MMVLMEARPDKKKERRKKITTCVDKGKRRETKKEKKKEKKKENVLCVPLDDFNANRRAVKRKRREKREKAKSKKCGAYHWMISVLRFLGHWF
jgi:hypothetical protein